jgi:hypothetical protein
MHILKLLINSKSAATTKTSNSLINNQELSQVEFVLNNFKWFFFMLKVCKPTQEEAGRDVDPTQ